MAKVAFLALAFLALAVAERSCLRKPDFMKHEHFAAFTEVDTNGDLSLSPAEIESSAAGDEVSTTFPSDHPCWHPRPARPPARPPACLPA
jgi:hypothetical protein